MATREADIRARDVRVDLLEIGRMIEPGSRVLDIGCGDGDLLYHLVHDRGVDARGMELSREGVNACVARGLSVVQGDADRDLIDYPTGAFDYAILSQTLQAMRDTRAGLEQMLRIGKRAIVSFPNFGYWKVRLQLLFRGRMPDTESLEYPWYNTPNIHLCTIRDFIELCGELGISIEKFIAIDAGGKSSRIAHSTRRANLMAEQALFLLAYDGKRDDAGAPLYGRR